MTTAPLTALRPRTRPPVPWDAVAPVAAAGLTLFAFALNVAYLLSDPPLELAPDEAHYWDWSRRLDWCYYSKGPLVAWIIRASRELFAGWSVAATGTELLAVRLPAAGCQVLLLWALYLLAARTLGKPRFGLATVAVALTLPAVGAVGLLMTIDAPFLVCWAWAAVFTQSAVRRSGGTLAWVAAGLAVAVGVLAKYTMLAFPGCVALYFLANRSERTHLRRPGPWLFFALGAAGLLPILLWNWQHEWIGFRHLLALANGPTHKPRPTVNLLGPLEFVAGQFVLWLGFWSGAGLAAGWANRPGRGDPDRRFLWWLAAPVWLFFLAASVRTSGELNWPAPAYVGGLVLAVGWVAAERWRIRAAVATGAVGATAIGFAHYPGLYRPVLASLVPAPTAERPAPVRKLDPTCRLAGWRTLAREIDRLREQATAEDGEEPVIACMTWTNPGEIAFYAAGNPQVFSVGVRTDDRFSQYDVWRPNPVEDAQAFRGRTFLYVGERLPEMSRVWDRVGSPVEVTASDGDVPVAAWKVWVCRGYRGFPSDGGRRPGGRY